MSEWNTQVIWLQLVVIMILALWLTEAKDNGKKISPCKTCKIINHNSILRIGKQNISLKSEICFHILGTSYSFVSQTSTCRHRKQQNNPPYYCKGGSGKVCEQRCSNWTACVGYSVLADEDKCILYPSLATPCPEGWSGEKYPVAKTALDLVDGGSSGYCKFKQG